MSARRPAVIRAAWGVGALGLAVGAVALWWSARPVPGHEGPELDLPAGLAAEAPAWFATAREAASGPASPPGDGAQEVWVCRMNPPTAPTCADGRGVTVADAVRAAAGGHPWLADGTVRIDVLLRSTPARWPRDTSPHLAGTRGLRVGTKVLLPSDVLAAGLFASEDEDENPRYDTDRIAVLLGVDGPSFDFVSLETATFVQTAPGTLPFRTYRLHAYERPTTDALEPAIRSGGEHLLRIVGEDGRIRYRWSPRLARELSGSNVLRHAGTTWSLLRVGERLGDSRYTAAAQRAIEWMLRHSGADERMGPLGGGRTRFLLEGSYLKLGGSGLALLALATYQQRTGDIRYATPAEGFATFLLSQQQESGEFWSYAPKVPGGERKAGTSAYYPGEAILGLLTWYAIDPDPRWLDTATRGADWLIDVRDAGLGPEELDADHWLMMALDRLHAATGDDRYADHALRLAEAVAHQYQRQVGHERFHRDYAGGFYEPPRSTPASIRVEGLGAVLDLCRRTNRDCDRFLPVLHGATAHVLQSQYGPEDGWWTSAPEEVVGGFAGGIVDPDLRNDYAQHAVCALLAAERHPLPGVIGGHPP